ncbi:MAG: DUF2207 domain-containing protein [Gammaproteobacteria bacterium]
MRLALLIAAIVATLLPAATLADERIHTFDSNISVHADGSMTVIETITVTSEGNRIKRGIYRDFPTDYRDRHGNRLRVGFEVSGIRRNGAPEPHQTQRIKNGIRVYIGRESQLIPHGQHTYEISYKTDRQLGFFAEHDELYWNVTGNEWEFPIDAASATLALPSPVSSDTLEASAYTGPLGSSARDASSTIESLGRVAFRTTRPLRAREGLTIVLAWPKGIVAEPTGSERLAATLQDNAHLISGLGGFAVLLAYYLLVWASVGRDPEPGVIIARYEPPPGYSPASMRYVAEMGYDNKCFTAAILNLAVKGYLGIEDDDGEYTLVRSGKSVAMAPGEDRLSKALFDRRKRVRLDNAEHAVFKGALEQHEQALSMDFETKYFVTNRNPFFLGVAISLTVVVTTVMLAPATIDMAGAGFLALWSGIWWTVTGLGVYRAWIHLRHGHGFATRMRSVFRLLFMVPFVIAGVLVIVPMMEAGATWLLLFGAVVLLTNFAFFHWLKAPTLLGRRLLDEVEGFKRYVEIAEKHELDYRYPEGRTPALFERYLPIAVALGIEQQWADQFSEVIAAAAANDGYAPVWYRGSHWQPDRLTSFSNSLGNAFNGAVAASSVAPGSSPGSGGGGFSGGGGGGGGGGGW